MSREINMKFSEHGIIKLPTLEDANSIQLGLAEVMRLLVTNQIDHRTASLLLRALRTAAANVKFTSLEPKPTHIVIDPMCVENRPLGATAWSTVEGQEYDLIETNNPETNNPETNHAETNHVETNHVETNHVETNRPIASLTRHSSFRDAREPRTEEDPDSNSTPVAETYPPMSEYRQRRNRENWS
jgi:hypothetical protein